MLKRNTIFYNSIWLFFLVLILDQGSKYLTYRTLPLMDYFYYEYPYGGIGLVKNFLGIELSISHATNTGAAWGILGNHPLILITLRLLLIGGLSIYTFFYNEQKSWQPFLALILAGAIGNVIDFMLYGHVIDMIHLVMWGYDFPVFNIADSAITLAVFALFILSLMNPKPNHNDE